MSTMMRYDPFREALSFRNAVDQLFEQSFVRPLWGVGGTQGVGVAMDVYEAEQGYQVQVVLPGVKPEDLDVSVQQNRLTIKGQRYPAVKQDRKVNWLLQEIEPGSFERSITFPREVKHMSCSSSRAYR